MSIPLFDLDLGLGLKEWVSDGVEFLAAKNAKFAKASNLRKTPLFDFDSRLRLLKPTNRQNLYLSRHSSAAKKEPGNPDKDLGNVRNLAYLALSENDQIFNE